MKIVDIYQTLEDRGNYKEVESHGPYFCSAKYSDGSIKTGVKVPWAGEGYYFWDSHIRDAHWWGETVYRKNGKNYIIGNTSYDQHSSLLFDTVSEPSLLIQLKECGEVIKRNRLIQKTTLAIIIEYLKKQPEFTYKAIRFHPDPINISRREAIPLPGDKFVLPIIRKTQICFFDRTLLTEPFCIIHKSVSSEAFTI